MDIKTILFIFDNFDKNDKNDVERRNFDKNIKKIENDFFNYQVMQKLCKVM